MDQTERMYSQKLATAAEAVISCETAAQSHWVVLSAGERQALEWMEKAK